MWAYANQLWCDWAASVLDNVQFQPMLHDMVLAGIITVSLPILKVSTKDTGLVNSFDELSDHVADNETWPQMIDQHQQQPSGISARLDGRKCNFQPSISEMNELRNNTFKPIMSDKTSSGGGKESPPSPCKTEEGDAWK